MTIFSQSIDADGIATLRWDLPGTSMNVLTEAGILELEAAIPALLADPEVRGVILTSAKPDFAGGMDLPTILAYKHRAMETEAPAAFLFSFTMRIHNLLRLIERGGADPKTGAGGKPFVWASPGTAVGIGTELALACHRRIAADNPTAKIGLPEIKVGLFPGSGGTTRLVRMLGLMGASEFLLQGKLVDPKRARAAGLIDEVVPPEMLEEAARAWLLQTSEGCAVKPWDKPGFKITGGAPYTAQGFPLFVGASALTLGKTQGAYPAAKAMLSAIYEGTQLPFDDAIRVEARWFTKVLLDPSAEAMIRTVFVNKQRLEKGPLEAAPRRIGVIGAGMMGAGIAHVAAMAGLDVILIDRDRAGVDRGVATVTDLLDRAIARKRMTPEAKAETLSRITATIDYADLSGADLVIEAVFEDPALKAEVIARAEAAMSETAILASNTSTLPIRSLAKASSRPERFLGIHFFSPVNRMLLVEIIRGAETDQAAIDAALAFVRILRKVPIVVNDARFFYANRCILPYGQEGARMVAEGVNPALIENAAKQLGMPVGPLQLTDETSLDLALSITRATKAEMGESDPESPAEDLIRTLVEDHGRKGRKSGGGFYSYDDADKRVGLWSGLAEIHPLCPCQPSLQDVQDRLIFIQAIEAVRAFEETVLTSVAEGDVGAVLGWGFAPWSGGPFGWLDILGAGEACARADRLAQRYGDRFTPPETLRKLARDRRGFYDSFG